MKAWRFKKDLSSVHDPDTDPHQVKSRIWIRIREKSDPDLDPMKEHWFVELV
jgi:hypothetical protein